MGKPQSDDEIMKYIEANTPCTAPEIAVSTGVHIRTVERSVNRLLRLDKIHISKFEKTAPGRGLVARHFSIGPGESAQYRKQTHSQFRKRRNAWQRQYRRRETILKRAPKMGVFGVLMAQL